MSEPLCLSIWKASGTLYSLIARHHHDISIDAHLGASSASRRSRRSRPLPPSQMYQPAGNKILLLSSGYAEDGSASFVLAVQTPFRGVLPCAPRACSKRVLSAVRSSCVVAFTVDSLRIADATSHHVWNLTQRGHYLTLGPFRTRSTHWVKSSSATNTLSLITTVTGCRSTNASHTAFSHRSVDG